MDDSAAVGHLDHIANPGEELETVGERETVGFAVLVECQSLDQFHHQVGTPIVELAAIDQPGNRRVFEGGQNLALAVEEASQLGGRQLGMDDLEGDPLVKTVVRALRQEDRAHPTGSEVLEDAVAAEATP